jgi:hypothetical protein
MTTKHDTKGRIITRKTLNRSMAYSLIGGGFGSVWFLFTSPQQLLILLVKNYLGASSSELGLFLGIMNIISVFHLAAIAIYAYRRTIKPFWLTVSFIHRSLTFLLAAASFYAAAGGSRRIALMVVMITSVLTFVLGNMAGSGWWAWINQIVPNNRRSTYFGQRSAVAQATNVIAFFTATIMIDVFTQQIFLVFGIIYLVAGVFGITESSLHIPIPEPTSAQANKVPFKVSSFFQPFRNRNFRTLCIVAGVSMMGISISAPFFVPMITDPSEIGAPTIWLGIMFAISQLTWVLIIQFWGTMMDRFGRKPVAMIGMLFPLSYLGYLFLTPQNYHYVLPAIALLGGVFSPALYEGLNQVMLSLVPQKNQTAYIAWYWALLGIIQGLGPIIGGYLLQVTGSISVLVISTLFIIFVSFILLDTVKTGKELKFTRLVSTLSSPNIIKAYMNMPVIARSGDKTKVGNALKTMRSSQGSLALDEILIRLEDPDDEVREEAVKALGRIGGPEVEDVLIAHMSTSESMVRTECAQALGRLGCGRAVPSLIDMLYSDDESLVKAAARALGKIESTDSTKALLAIIREPRSLKIKITSAEGLSAKQERIAILQEILSLFEQTENPVMQKQLIISVGNIIGKPGEFYSYLTGTEQAREDAVQKLFRAVSRHLKTMERTSKGLIDHIVFETLPATISHFEAGDKEETIKGLSRILMNLIYREITLQQSSNELSAEHMQMLAKEAPRLYAAYTLLLWFQRFYGEETSRISDNELLLLFYALRYYKVAF